MTKLVDGPREAFRNLSLPSEPQLFLGIIKLCIGSLLLLLLGSSGEFELLLGVCKLLLCVLLVLLLIVPGLSLASPGEEDADSSCYPGRDQA
jgi:hypothetical protein